MPNYRIGVEVDADAKDSAKELRGVGGALDALDDSFGGSIKNVGAFGVTLGDVLSPVGLVTAGVGALGAALVATASHAMELATEVEGSTTLMTTQLGLTTEQAGAFEDTMRSIYTNNYGDSFDDIAASMVAVEQQFRRIGGTETQAELQEATELAISFADAFDKDVGESASAAVTLMENFGLTATEAFGFMTKGQQEGLDASGDFLDTIGEYAGQFSQAGADASAFFNILESGQAGGVLGTDKMANAFKEFNIRILDDSTTTKTALDSIGISYETLRQGFADGSITQVDAMQLVIDKLNEIEDPIERNKAGVALFGTQWEDITETVLLEVDLQKTALGDLEEAAASLGDQYDNTANRGQTAMREWNNALVDVGDSFNELKDIILPGLTLILTTLVIPKIEEITGWFEQLIDLMSRGAEGLAWLLGIELPEDTPSVQAQSTNQSSVPVNLGGGTLTPAMAGVDAGGVTQHFYIERGDAATVERAAEVGVGRAQRARGF